MRPVMRSQRIALLWSRHVRDESSEAADGRAAQVSYRVCMWMPIERSRGVAGRSP